MRYLVHTLGLAVPPYLMVAVCAQDAKSVRPCSPPSVERCLGGRITDLYNGCGPAYAGTAPPPFNLFRGFFSPPTLGELPWWAMHVASRSILWLVCHWILQKGKDLRRVRRQHEEHHVRPLLFLFLGPISDPGTRNIPLPTLLEPTQTASCAARTSQQQLN